MEDSAGLAPFLLGIFMGALVRDGGSYLKSYGVKVSEDRTAMVLRFDDSKTTYRIAVDFKGFYEGMPDSTDI